MTEVNDLDLTSFSNAILSLESAFKLYTKIKDTSTPAESELLRDGVIQRFEYTFELAWKSLRRYFRMYAFESIETMTNRQVFRKAAELGLITNVEAWFEYLLDRNQTSHVYDDEIAKDVFESIRPFITDVKILLQNLQNNLA